MKWYLNIFMLLICFSSYSQENTNSNYLTKKLAVADTIKLDSVQINPSKFKITSKKGIKIDSTAYQVDFEKATIVFSEKFRQSNDSVVIDYLRYPDFLTRDYFVLDPKIIVESNGSIEKLYALQNSNQRKKNIPFEGLNTLGSISRGVTIGNNQNTVVNSELDLQITGKLNDKVSIRASIQDANIPTQEGGFSQSLDEFDQIFIELFSDNWKIRAGDVDLQNNTSHFGRFTKKVQGISLGGTITHKDGSKTSAFASGALVRGVFQRSQFTGQEGNQGPYKLVGPNGELFILIVSGSERVYVNGLLLKRGENEDYVIDYNAGEVTFNSTYPITTNMRVSIEYQFTDRNFTRFIGYGGGNYSSKTLDIGAYIYSESDARNQPLQQSLTEEQINILALAGDDRDLFNAPSAIPDTFSENRTLYRKETLDGVEIFVFSNNPEDELFNVRFSAVGENRGNYVISVSDAINRIFEYVPPIDGIPQGDFEPIIQLNPPEKIQIGGINGNYHPSDKTNIDFEIAGSINDQNLFSDIDDDDNEGFASRLAFKQNVLTTTDTLQLNAFASLDYVQENFRTIERLYNIEFSRDWNLINPLGNQSFTRAGVQVTDPKKGVAQYEFQNLNFSESFNGIRQLASANLQFNKIKAIVNASLLDAKSDSISSSFARLHNVTTYSFKKAWVGGKLGIEDNQIKVSSNNDSLTPASQRFTVYEVFTGVGDSTKVFAEVGYRYRVNDSVRNSILQRVNTSNTYFFKSKIINNQKAQLSLFANYRTLQFSDNTKDDENNLNARLLYSQSLWKGGVRLSTALESNSGVIPQQEFTFVQVEPGQGVFIFIDFNNNGIQELNEFEIAPFPDQAEYIRVLLPNQVFINIRNNKLSQIVTLNPQQWATDKGLKKILSRFHNQSSYIIDRRIARDNDVANINPFKSGGDDELGLNLNFRNTLFFNRGKQRYTTNYTFISSSTSNLIALGLQENRLQNHQVSFNHKFKKLWLLNVRSSLGENESTSENFENRNFSLSTYELNPRLSYLLNRQTRFNISYEYANKQNTLGELEELNQQNAGISFAYNNAQKISISGEFNFTKNNFTGNAFSPVAFTILEGLQPGTNFTWNVLFQKKITKYLDANLSYFGRKSENSNTIHTGNVQLRAYF